MTENGIEGGQGRTGAEVQLYGAAIVWAVGAALLLFVWLVMR